MEKGKEYKVISPFRDLQDKSKEFPNGRVYAIGDSYSNDVMSPERIKQLEGINNAAGKKLIECHSGLNDLTVKELKELAKDKEIENYSTMKKEELIEAIEGE